MTVTKIEKGMVKGVEYARDKESSNKFGDNGCN